MIHCLSTRFRKWLIFKKKTNFEEKEETTLGQPPVFFLITNSKPNHNLTEIYLNIFEKNTPA